MLTSLSQEQQERESVNMASQEEESVVRVLPSSEEYSSSTIKHPTNSTSSTLSTVALTTDTVVSMPSQGDYSRRRHSLTKFVKKQSSSGSSTSYGRRGISFLNSCENMAIQQDNIDHQMKRIKRISTANTLIRSVTTNSCFVLEEKDKATQSSHHASTQQTTTASERSLETPSISKQKSSNASCISVISSNQRRRKSDIFSNKNASFNSSVGSFGSREKIPLEFSADFSSSRNGFSIDDESSKKAEATENREWLKNESLKFNQSIDNQISTVEDAKLLVKKTREISMLSNSFMLASTENECYEIVSRLLHSLFGVDRCSYTLMMDEENFLLQECAIARFGPTARDIIFSDGEEDAAVHPLQDCATEHCAESLDAFYCQDIERANLYPEYKTFRRVGSQSFLSVPILIGARKFAGALHIASEHTNAFNEMDIMMIKDIGYRLGGHLYSKRLQEEQDESYDASRKLLQSMIPGSVLEKIEDHWKSSLEQNDDDDLSLAESCPMDCSATSHETQSKDDARQHFSRKDLIKKESSRRGSLTKEGSRRGSLTKEGSRRGSLTKKGSGRGWLENMGILKKEPTLLGKKHLTPTSSITSESVISESEPVLFAETQSNVSMIFCDIVGFSRIARDLQPFQVMQMLNDLYHIFDHLCEKHRVRKLETIGDTYIVSGGLLEEANDNDAGKGAAMRCLAMAQDMVREASNVYAPTEPRERIQIRLGIHVGNLSYGILGQNVPKFSVYGDAVNIAARMEQTAPVGKVHVSKAFHDLVNNEHILWKEKRNTKVKNVGVMETWIMDSV